jgi:hypothetical protein
MWLRGVRRGLHVGTVFHYLRSRAVNVGRFTPENRTPGTRRTDVVATRYFSALASNRTSDSPVTQPTRLPITAVVVVIPLRCSTPRYA